MSAKSRSNYPIGMYITEEQWNNIFKENCDESKIRSEITNGKSNRVIQKESSELSTKD